MGMRSAPTWLRQVSPPPLLHKTILTTGCVTFVQYFSSSASNHCWLVGWQERHPVCNKSLTGSLRALRGNRYNLGYPTSLYPFTMQREVHCFILGSKLTFSTNLFHHSLLAPTWTAFSDYTGPDLLSAQRFFIFSYFFYFGSCGRLSWLNCQLLSSAR